MGFNSAFKGLIIFISTISPPVPDHNHRLILSKICYEPRREYFFFSFSFKQAPTNFCCNYSYWFYFEYSRDTFQY